MEYLGRNKILSDKQSSFLERSWLANLLSVCTRVAEISNERKGRTDSVFVLGLRKKTFHTVLSWQVMNDLEGKIWMKHYLHGRKMQTMIRDEKSNWGRATSGALLGSVLAPALCLVYQNDVT